MQYLCHYTTDETAQNIIKNMSLKFGKVSNSNDPIEIKRFELNCYGDNNEIEGKKKQTNKYLNNILRLIAFSKGEIKNINEYENEIELEDDTIDSLEISKLSKRPPYYLTRMWAQYADNHNGVCLIFNKDVLIKEIKNRICNDYVFKYGNIKYKNFLSSELLIELAETHLITDDDIDYIDSESIVHSYLRNNYKTNYFMKDLDWRDEKEFRLLLWNKIENNNTDDLFLPITNMALIGVVLGMNNYNDTVGILAKEKHIKNIFKIEFNNIQIGLEYV